MENVTLTIVVALLSSGALSALITGLFNIWQTKKSKKDGLESKVGEIAKKQTEITDRLKTAEKDALRTQLMVLIKDFPDERTDILRLAETYFDKLGGNWILTDIFARWCDEYDVQLPSWFNRD